MEYLYIMIAIQVTLILGLVISLVNVFTRLEKAEFNIVLLEESPTAAMVRIEYETRLRVLEELHKIGR